MGKKKPAKKAPKAKPKKAAPAARTPRKRSPKAKPAQPEAEKPRDAAEATLGPQATASTPAPPVDDEHDQEGRPLSWREILRRRAAAAPTNHGRDPISEAVEALRARVLEAAGLPPTGRNRTLASREVWPVVFLEALRVSGCPTVAARIATIRKGTAYDKRRTDPEFAKEWRAALREAADGLVVEARRRAVDGTDKGVYYEGALVDVQREYSDKLLMFLLQGLKPKTFRQRKEVTHKQEAGLVPGDRKGLYADIVSRLHKSTN